jgi:CRISPR system Cascade subunit CasC
MRLIQIHVLQSYPVAALNADKSGGQKTMVFGGYLRARVSSQAWKRPIREMLDAQTLQTRLLPTLVREELKALTQEEAVLDAISARVSEFGRKAAEDEVEEELAPKQPKSKRAQRREERREDVARTSQLLRVTRREVAEIAKSLHAVYEEIGADAFKKTPISDLEAAARVTGNEKDAALALFGRFTTTVALGEFRGATSTAHAFSVHPIRPAADFFTGMDDLEINGGSAMMGFKDMAANLFYRYANVDWDQLVENMGGDEKAAGGALTDFVSAFAMAQPKASRSFAAPSSLPGLILVEKSSVKLPVSYGNAYLTPVLSPENGGMMNVASQALAGYITLTDEMYSLGRERAYLSVDEFAHGTRMKNVQSLAEWAAA